MMKKFGFTLAEVLITLTIIGVVAALTTPALYHNASIADIGPKLAKFRATVEEANKRILIENDVNRLSTLITVHGDDDNFYTDELQKFMRINENNEGYTVAKYDGSEIEGDITVSTSVGATRNIALNNNPFNFRTVEGMSAHFDMDVNNDDDNSAGVVLVDINGSDRPNRIGRDVFGFVMDNNGMLTPLGSPSIAKNASDNWNNSCTSDSDENFNALTCTASIFANERRVIYQD